MPKLLKFVRGDKHVKYRVTRKGHQAEEELDVTCHEAPLASLDKALQDLAPVACKVLEVPSDWAETVKVDGVTFTYTKKGTGSAAVTITKTLAGLETPFTITTPFFRFEKAAQGEEGRMEVSAGHAQRVALAIEQCEDYINGKRQQMLLPLPDPSKPVEPSEGDELAIGDGSRGKKSK